MAVKFTNNAKTTLASSLTNVATSASVVDGSVFPTLGAGEYFYCTFDDGSNNEIVKVTARSGNTLTIVRGVDNTTARAFSSGDAAELRATAGLLTDIQENIAAKSANQTVYNTTTASSATDYDIGIDPSVEANAMVFLNGVMQHHDTFSFSGSTLTFDTAPSDGMALEVIVDNLINLQSSNLTVDTFTAADVSGSPQTDFTLSDTPAAESNLIVFVDGVFQDQDAYTISTNVLTMTDGVIADRVVTVYVINPVNIGTPSDGTVTSAKLSGNITMPGSLTVTSYDVAFDSPTFVVDNANSRVGIGTAAPTTLLDIVGDVKMSAGLQVSGIDYPTSDGTNGQVLTTNGSGTLSFGDIPAGYTDSDVESYLNTSAIYTDATNDRLGIGDSSPATKLEILDANGVGLRFGDIAAAPSSQTAGYIGMSTSAYSGNNGDLVLFPRTSSASNILLNGGKVGIGLTVPDATLEVLGTTFVNSSTSSRPAVVISGGYGGALGFEDTKEAGFYAQDSGDTFHLYVGRTLNTDAPSSKIVQTWKSSGNVGINWGNPTARLGIIQSGSSTPGLNITDGSTSDFHVLAGYSSGYCVIGPSAGALAIKTANTVRTTITSSGTLEHSGNNGAFAFGASSGNVTRIRGNADGLHMHYGSEGNPRLSLGRDEYQSGQAGIVFNEPGYGKANGGVGIGSATRGQLAFSTSDYTTFTERMRIKNDGTVMINRTSSFGAANATTLMLTGSGNSSCAYWTCPNTANYDIHVFFNGGLGVIGSIRQNSSLNGVAYNTSSDYRLKENVTYDWDATTRLKQLKPCRFNWISDETNTLEDGFLAHEVATSVPNAVTGIKDAMTAEVLYEETDQEVIDGEAQVGDVKEEAKINPQQLDHSKLVPLLVKTIQELEARITELENA